MRFLKVKEIKEEEGYGNCKYKLNVYFDNESCWVAKFSETAKMLEIKAQIEDKRFPYGMGRNMFLLAFLYPIYKDYLDKYGFAPPQKDVEFANENRDRRNNPNDE